MNKQIKIILRSMLLAGIVCVPSIGTSNTLLAMSKADQISEQILNKYQSGWDSIGRMQDFCLDLSIGEEYDNAFNTKVNSIINTLYARTQQSGNNDAFILSLLILGKKVSDNACGCAYFRELIYQFVKQKKPEDKTIECFIGETIWQSQHEALLKGKNTETGKYDNLNRPLICEMFNIMRSQHGDWLKSVVVPIMKQYKLHQAIPFDF